jgi:hypothetical protein
MSADPLNLATKLCDAGRDARPYGASQGVKNVVTKKTPTRKAASVQKTTPVPKVRQPRGANAPAKPRPRRARRLRSQVAGPIPGLLLEELHTVKAMVQQLLAPTQGGDAFEASVDALRRVLGALIDERMDALMDDLIAVRRDASVALGSAGQPVVDRLDRLLQDLGAVRFEAEPMDIVDPLIHSVVEERRADGTPEGVVLETKRPGFRSVRGRVLCKAAVAVSRGA